MHHVSQALCFYDLQTTYKRDVIIRDRREKKTLDQGKTFTSSVFIMVCALRCLGWTKYHFHYITCRESQTHVAVRSQRPNVLLCPKSVFQYFISLWQCFLSPVSLLQLFSISQTFIRYCYRRSHLPLVSFLARINCQFYQHICSQLFGSVVFLPLVALVAVRLKSMISLVVSSSDSLKCRNNFQPTSVFK